MCSDMRHYISHFSITDLALFTAAFPSGTAVIRRWNVAVCAVLWLSWLALLIVKRSSCICMTGHVKLECKC